MTNGKQRSTAATVDVMKASLKDAILYSDAHVEICQAAGIPLDPKHGAPVTSYRHLVESWKSVFTGINIIVNRFRAERDAALADAQATVNRLQAERDRISKDRDSLSNQVVELTAMLAEEDKENTQHRVTDVFRTESLLAAPVATKVLEELGSPRVLNAR